MGVFVMYLSYRNLAKILAAHSRADLAMQVSASAKIGQLNFNDMSILCAAIKPVLVCV